jgi:hypothetical protein
MTQPNPPRFLQTTQPSRTRQFLALGVAVTADLIHWAFFPVMAEGGMSPFDWVEDGIVTVILLLILGFRWELIVAFGLELVPFIDMFPTWTAFMLFIMAESYRKSGPGIPPQGLPVVPPVQPNTPQHPPVTVERVK